MRLLNTLGADVRFQLRYGFYSLYAFFSLIYILGLRWIPVEAKSTIASLIILSDPALLGVFFIGGIWLLEQGEGLHRVWAVSPLRPLEYAGSKAATLALLSTVCAQMIVIFSLGIPEHFLRLSLAVFLGALGFNFIGLTTATYAHSVNHYLLIIALPSAILAVPPVLTALGWAHPFLELFPGTALWRLIAAGLQPGIAAGTECWITLLVWLLLAGIFACRRSAAAFAQA